MIIETMPFAVEVVGSFPELPMLCAVLSKLMGTIASASADGACFFGCLTVSSSKSHRNLDFPTGKLTDPFWDLCWALTGTIGSCFCGAFKADTLVFYCCCSKSSQTWRLKEQKFIISQF